MGVWGLDEWNRVLRLGPDPPPSGPTASEWERRVWTYNRDLFEAFKKYLMILAKRGYIIPHELMAMPMGEFMALHSDGGIVRVGSITYAQPNMLGGNAVLMGLQGSADVNHHHPILRRLNKKRSEELRLRVEVVKEEISEHGETLDALVFLLAAPPPTRRHVSGETFVGRDLLKHMRTLSHRARGAGKVTGYKKFVHKLAWTFLRTLAPHVEVRPPIDVNRIYVSAGMRPGRFARIRPPPADVPLARIRAESDDVRGFVRPGDSPKVPHFAYRKRQENSARRHYLRDAGAIAADVRPGDTLYTLAPSETAGGRLVCRYLPTIW